MIWLSIAIVILVSKLHIRNLRAGIRVGKLIRLSEEIVMVEYGKGVIGNIKERISTNPTT